jgi:hypothetical protein
VLTNELKLFGVNQIFRRSERVTYTEAPVSTGDNEGRHVGWFMKDVSGDMCLNWAIKLLLFDLNVV